MQAHLAQRPGPQRFVLQPPEHLGSSARPVHGQQRFSSGPLKLSPHGCQLRNSLWQ